MYKTVNVDLETFRLIDEMSKSFGIKKLLLIKTIIIFFSQNKSLINADFFKKSEFTNLKEIDDKFERMFSIISKKETNRLISFIKVQDKYMQDMKRDILYKLNPDMDSEWNPLFEHYDFILKYFDLFLSSIDLSMNDVINSIKDKSGFEQAEYFKKSLMITSSKQLGI